jgi:hypothetical protein
VRLNDLLRRINSPAEQALCLGSRINIPKSSNLLSHQQVNKALNCGSPILSILQNVHYEHTLHHLTSHLLYQNSLFPSKIYVSSLSAFNMYLYLTLFSLFPPLITAQNNFLNPPSPGATADFSSNLIWTLGSTQKIQWVSDFESWTLMMLNHNDIPVVNQALTLVGRRLVCFTTPTHP